MSMTPIRQPGFSSHDGIGELARRGRGSDREGYGPRCPARHCPNKGGDEGLSIILGDLEIAHPGEVPLTLVIVNSAARGYLKGLQHALCQGSRQSLDFKEMNCAGTAREMSCHSLRMEDPKSPGGACGRGSGKGPPQSDGRGRDS